MATMLDVSRHAGIPKVTVPYILNGTGQVKENTRQKVSKAMQVLDYRPNFLACSLTNRTGNSAGLIVSIFNGFCFGRLLQQASRRMKSRGEQLIVIDGRNTPEHEQEAVQILANRQCDTIILYTRYMSEKAIMSLMNSIAMSLLVINRDVSQTRDRAILFEQGDATYQAINYLIFQGHSDIACIAVPGHTPTGKLRLMGYCKALEKNDIPWDSDKVKYGDSTMTRNYEACRELLEEGVKFSAPFACSDDMALDAPETLHQVGLRIPTGVSLLGFGDVSSVKWPEPGLSTVYLPTDTVITTVIDWVIRLADGENVEPISPFTGKLVLCDSTAAGPRYRQRAGWRRKCPIRPTFP